MIPLVGFPPIDDPRVTATTQAVSASCGSTGSSGDIGPGLTVRRSMACRPVKAHSCSAASGWRTATRAAGSHAGSSRAFERLLAVRNDLGLLSEEYDPAAKQLLGNFRRPSRIVSLINTARNLRTDWDRRTIGSGQERRAESNGIAHHVGRKLPRHLRGGVRHGRRVRPVAHCGISGGRALSLVNLIVGRSCSC